MKKWTLIALSIFALSACGNDSSKSEVNQPVAPAASAVSSVASSSNVAPSNHKVYRFAIEREFTPFIVPGENGTVTGFEADVLEAIAQVQGFKVEFLPMDWKYVFPQLEEGKVDIAGSGIIMTEERKQKWDFSDPFIVAKFAVVVPQDSTITKSEDLQDKRVAVQPESAFAEFAHSKTKNIVSTKTIWISIKETMSNNADAAMVNTVIADHFVAKYADKNLKVVAFNNDRDIPLGYALKKGNTELQKQINEGLAKIKSDGTYDKLKEKWGIKNH